MSKLSLLKRLFVLTVAALMVGWLLFPAVDVVCPSWDVVVTDTEGHPIEGASLTVSSQQYTLERIDHQVTHLTGADGRVHFDERRIRAMNLFRLVGAIRNLDQGVHASFGAHTSVYATAKGYGYPSELKLFGQNEQASRANGNARQSSHIVLMRCPTGYSGFGCSFPEDPSQPAKSLRH